MINKYIFFIILLITFSHSDYYNDKKDICGYDLRKSITQRNTLCYTQRLNNEVNPTFCKRGMDYDDWNNGYWLNPDDECVKDTFIYELGITREDMRYLFAVAGNFVGLVWLMGVVMLLTKRSK